MSYSAGSLVRARGREWVVLPESRPDLLVLRPLGGTDDEIAGILPSIEPVEPAVFDLPDPTDLGDHRSCRLLRDAVRLGFRSSAGPFRSFGRIAVEPRPYQLVPLLMALKLDPVRLLIADDVGIGKTVEASLIARELLDRGEIRRIAVLCPPPLAEQWQAELAEKFHIEAELVLPSTARRLERRCRVGESLFEVYPHVIVSTDFIKSERRRDEFLRTCPEFVMVDEAHTCAPATGGRVAHQRWRLVSGLAERPDRHLVLVTATPHSGKEESFRALLALLDPSFAQLPDDLSGRQNQALRRRLAAHFVQRRRADIRHYLQADTPFPERLHAEETYTLSPEYRRLFDRALAFARERVRDPRGGAHRQRVRWWSALALLRSLASSPAAAAATLRSRAANLDAASAEEADDLGRRAVLDLVDEESLEAVDVVPGADLGDEPDGTEGADRRRLLAMAREAEALCGRADRKLAKGVKIVQALLDDGFHPIVFCRFIPTAEYLGAELRRRLGSDVAVEWVTGNLPPAEREDRVLALSRHAKRVLVCTDCLSEGINLQEHFDAVVHYDLPWNPTRLEQREGRVDRFGQSRPKVRAVTYYGTDNQIDGIVLDVLIRKHRTIRNSLGISVPVPVETEQVVEAVFEGLLLREQSGEDTEQLLLPGLEEYLKPRREALFERWEAASEREARSRTLFAQESLKPEEVLRELEEARRAVGSGLDVAAFVREALRACGATVGGDDPIRVDLTEVPPALRDLIRAPDGFEARFSLPVREGQLYLARTHPLVEGLAAYVMDTALDPETPGVGRRCGVIRTRAVARRTTLLLLRFRFHLHTRRAGHETTVLAEECGVLAFEGPPDEPEWLSVERAEALLGAEPHQNVTPDQARGFVEAVLSSVPRLVPSLENEARQRAEALLAAHRRVREAARARGSYRVEPQLPVDVLGVYVYLPAVAVVPGGRGRS